jgi:hypothetical protein
MDIDEHDYIDRHWSAAEISRLLLLWQNNSASQCGKQLNRTRSAICGKMGRLRRAGLAPPEPKGPYIVPVRKAPRAPPAKRKRIRSMQSKPLPPIDDRLAMAPCSLIELTPRRCRWPLGEVNAVATLFCGGRTAGRGQPYCPHHFRIAFRRDPVVNKQLTGGGNL